MKAKPKSELHFRSKAGFLILFLAGFVFMVNANFAMSDLVDPVSMLRKIRNVGGTSYLISFAAIWGAVVGLIARSVTTGLRK